MNAIELSHLTHRFGRNVALNDVSFSVPEGSFFALLGPNGAGKSTTLKILLNLLSPTSGEARVLGKPSTQVKAKDFERIGYIAEGQDLPEWMKGEYFLRYCRSFYPNWDKELESRLSRDFRAPLDRPIKHLSRGQRMQLALLSTLPFRPELLILDEPFSGLDPLVRDDLILGLLELPDDIRPRTLVISSHDIDEVERLTDEVAFLAESRLLVRESAEALRARFRRVEVASQVALQPALKPQWYDPRQASERVLQFIVGDFDATTEATLRSEFLGAHVDLRPMTLREIFVALARRERLAPTTAA